MKRLSTILAAGAIILSIGIAVWATGVRGAADKPDEKASLGALKEEGAQLDESKKGPVPTSRVESLEQDTVLRLTGALAADEKSDVASSTNGIVEKVYVERGSVVEKGAPLVEVDPTDMKNMLAEGEAGVEELKVRLGLADLKEPYDVENQPEVKMAKSALDLTELNFKRYENLHKQGALSKAEFDRMQCEYNSAVQRYDQAKHQMRQVYQSYLTGQARLKMLRKALEDTVVVAPFGGFVAERYVNVGERVTTNPMGQGSKIVTLVKLDPLRLALTVPQQNAEKIRPGLAVNFRVDGLSDKTFTGEIKYVGPSVESFSRSMTVEAVVANKEGLLRPGMFASAEVSLPAQRTRLFVPAAAAVRQGDIVKIFVAKDGVATEQVVSLGETKGDTVEVTSGLKGDETVVTAPERVHDGDRVL